MTGTTCGQPANLFHGLWISAGQGRNWTPGCVAVHAAGWENKDATLTANEVARATAAKRSPGLTPLVESEVKSL